MVFNLERFMPKERIELSPEKRAEYAKHYAGKMEYLGYKRDAQNATAFDRIADYFGRWYAGTHGECSMPEKGLFLFGTKGTGKTTALRLFSGFFDVDIISVEELTKAFSIGQAAKFWEIAAEYRRSHLIVDDVCNEETVKSFGNSLPMAQFIKEREDLLQCNDLYTFYTSNAKGREEITAMYGDTITSRILGSCEFIGMAGSDRRIVTRKNQ